MTGAGSRARRTGSAPSLAASVFIVLALAGCVTFSGGPDFRYREGMRSFVIDIALYARTRDADFIIVPQNGQELFTLEPWDSGSAPAADYLAAIDGTGREDLFFGYDGDDIRTPDSEREYLRAYLEVAKAHGIAVITTDYCQRFDYIDESYRLNKDAGFISFAADRRELDNIPYYPAVPFNVNADPVSELSEARNFLYLINPTVFENAGALVDALALTDYDLLVIDLFDDYGVPLTSDQVARLKTKANGAARLVLAYLSIGEAEDYRFYWDEGWDEAYGDARPSWLLAENPDWAGNYAVDYRDPAWQGIIFGTPAYSYLDRILDAGFDGAYLDLIEAYEFFE